MWLWRCFIDRLPLSQGIQKGKRKNQKMRQALLGENTNKDKFPLSVSKEFSSSYLISFLWNVSRDFNIFLLRLLVSLTTLSVSPWISPNTWCAVIGVLSVSPKGHYFHSLIVLLTFCSIIVIQTVLVLLSKHRWVTVPALKSVYSLNKPFQFSTQDKTHQLQL